MQMFLASAILHTVGSNTTVSSQVTLLYVRNEQAIHRNFRRPGR